MSDLYWLWQFASAFFTTVVVGCAQPSNWEHCFPAHKWIIPWMRDVVIMYEDGPYRSEKCALSSDVAGTE